MKIFIDFDDVIFNTARFKRDLIKIFGKNGVSRREFIDSYRILKKINGNYCFEDHIKILGRRNKILLNHLPAALKKFAADLKKYVFRDALFFLKSFSKNDFYLISCGDKKFQMMKILNAGIKSCLKKIIIIKSDKSAAIKRAIGADKKNHGELIIFIDDKLEHLKEVFTDGKILTIHLNRNNKDKKSFYKKVDYQAKNLTQALKILNKF